MSAVQPPTFTQEDINLMLSVIHNLFDESARIFNQYNLDPSSGSQAVQEIASYPNPDLVKDVYSRGMLSMESAADHLIAFADSLKNPVKTIASWTCVRGLLETSALAVWFFDPNIDAQTRVGRCFAFRYVGFDQQIKFLRVANMQAELTQSQARMMQVEQAALQLGFNRVLNKNGDMDGIAQRMPSITDLIGTTLNQEEYYRLLSGVAHGHHWATTQLGFQIVEGTDSSGNSQKFFEKFSNPNNF